MPPHMVIFPQSHRIKIEIAILFNIVENLINMSLDDLILHIPPGEGLQVMNFAHCLHIVLVIDEVY